MRGPSYLGLTRSISWLLMPWLLTLPRHQQPWYWLCRIHRSWSYLRKDFKYLCMWSNDIKCKYMFMFPLKNLARKGLKGPQHRSISRGSHRVWKTWKNKIFWKSHGKSWNFEKSSKVMEKSWNLENLTPINHPPSIRNLALISFASHLVACIHSNTSDYELLGEFEANPLVYCYWFLI